MIGMSVPCSFLAKYRSTWRNEFVLLLPIVAILALVSSQTGFSVHSRYVLPILPFAYVWCSKVARSFEAGHKIVAFCVSVTLCWSVGSSLWSYPHSLSYFNELVGGPKNGHNHLLDSNIAWGQDLYFLKDWYNDHPEARPLHLAYLGLMDARLVGIEYEVPPVAPTSPNSAQGCSLEQSGPLPGWYAIDVNFLHGTDFRTADGQGSWQSMTRNGCDLTCFQQFQPVATAGYSIYIYHITLDDANRVRKELGLPELKDEGGVRHD